jgi:hypothetical protein
MTFGKTLVQARELHVQVFERQFDGISSASAYTDLSHWQR